MTTKLITCWPFEAHNLAKAAIFLGLTARIEVLGPEEIAVVIGVE